MVAPLGLPDHHTASNDGEAACDEHGNSRIGHNGGDESAKRDKYHADCAHGELEQDGVQCVVSKGGNDQGSEARDGAIDSISDCARICQTGRRD